MKTLFPSERHFCFPSWAAYGLRNLSKIFTLSVALIWVSIGSITCCELFSQRPVDHHGNYALAEDTHEIQAPDPGTPIPCELMEEQSAVVTEGAPATKIKNTSAVDCIFSQSAIVTVIAHRPSILQTVYHPPPPLPYFLRTSRLLI